jgi:Ornithine cyclodeaminase/mu-crystallin family
MSTLILGRAEVLKHTSALRLLNEFRVSAQQCGAEPPELSEHQVETGSGEGEGVPKKLLSIRHRANDVPLALFDAETVLSLTQSLLAALAVEILAPERVRRVAFLGRSDAVVPFLKAVRLVRTIDALSLFESDILKSFQLARHLQTSLGVAVTVGDSPAEAALGAEVVFLTGEVTLPSVELAENALVIALPEPIAEKSLSSLWHVSARGDSAIPSSASDLFTRIFAKQETAASGPRGFVCVPNLHFQRLAVWHIYESARDDKTLPSPDLIA